MSTTFGYIVCLAATTTGTIAIAKLGVDDFWYVIVIGVVTAISRAVGQFEGELK